MKYISLLIIFLLSCSTVPETINGCTDSAACNYNPEANEDDGSCSMVSDMCGVCDNDPDNDCEKDCTGIYGGNALATDCAKCSSNSFDCMGNCCEGGFIYDIQTETQTDTFCFLLDNCNVCDSNPSNDCIQDCAGIWGGDHIEDENGFTNITFNNQTYERSCGDLFALQDMASANNFTVDQGIHNENPFHSWDFDQSGQVESWEIGGLEQVSWWENGRLSKLKISVPFILTDAIGSLSELTELVLETSQLTSLPDSIGALSKLSKLSVTSNSLLSLPESISKLDKLTELLISNNYIENLPSGIGSLVNLKRLDARNNQLVTLPESIGDLRSLEYFLIENNKLIILPVNFGNLSSLLELSLSGNRLKIFPENFGLLLSLEVLLANNNKIQSIEDSFSTLINLHTLRLNSNMIESLPSSISGMQSLVELWLQNNKINSLPSDIGNLDKLVTLFINNNLLKSIPESIGDMESLQYLNVNNNLLDQLPDAFCNIFSDLNIFSVDNNFICDSELVPSCIGSYVDEQVCVGCLPNEFLIEGYCADTSDYNILQNFLDLNPESQSLPGNAGLPLLASDVVNTEWWENGRLVEITFQHKKITSKIPDDFGKLEKLRILRLTGNEMIGVIPDSLMNLTDMLTLKLSSNKFTGSIPNNISALINLDTLDCSDNNFSGSLPENLFELAKMTYLDINSNNFTGSIPDNIGNLKNAKYIYMNHNELSGNIPLGIGSLPELKNLKLHVNLVSGIIPDEICNIYINNENARVSLDNNLLCPPYPDCINIDQLGYKYGGFPWNDTFINQDCE